MKQNNYEYKARTNIFYYTSKMQKNHVKTKKKKIKKKKN